MGLKNAQKKVHDAHFSVHDLWRFKVKVQLIRCAASFVTATYYMYAAVTKDLRALNLELFTLPSQSDF